jgi:alpha-galactosidase
MINAKAISKRLITIHFVQIDDGYETRLGDWLSPRDAQLPTTHLFESIRLTGSEPAIWVAPFIAEVDSVVALVHPDWFVQGNDGLPLRSDNVGSAAGGTLRG